MCRIDWLAAKQAVGVAHFAPWLGISLAIEMDMGAGGCEQFWQLPHILAQ